MSSICGICLRINLKLASVEKEKDLERFYDELCEYQCDTDVQLCAECLYKLKKCYQFKMRCQLAAKTFKAWSKQKKTVRKSIGFLYTELPNAQLSLCNKNNFKVYFYQAPDVNTAAPIQISNCRHPHVVTVNIPPSEYTEDVQIEPPLELVKSEPINEEIDCLAEQFDDSNDVTYEVEYTETAIDNVNTNDIYAKIDLQFDSDASIDELVTENNDVTDKDVEQQEKDSDEVDSDASLEEFITKIQAKMLAEKDNPPPKRKKNPVLIRDRLKKMLRNKFEMSGVVKDENGKVINLDVVLSCLDKSPLQTVVAIKNSCLGSGTLKPAAIRKLSELQNRFTRFESVFTTEYLTDESQIREEFEKRREYTAYINAQYRCEKCLRGYKSSKALDYHIKNYHDESAGLFSCIYCQMTFKTKLAQSKHTAIHSLLCKCKLCPFVTNHKGSLRRHYDLHIGNKYRCKYCDVEYKWESMLYCHYNRAHSSNRLICEFCALAFYKEHGLAAHKHLKHSGQEFIQSELNKKCVECNITFITEDVYQKHLRITHKVVPRRQRAVREKPKIEGDVKCHLCDWQGRTWWLRLQHLKAEHPKEYHEQKYNHKKYLCHDCGKGFTNKTSYQCHMNTHTGVRPFACPKCPKRFFAQSLLSQHMLWHAPPSFECERCGKMFATNTARAVHMRTHIGDRRFKCNLCNKGFLHPGSLREHVNGVHLNIRRKKRTLAKQSSSTAEDEDDM